jgi:hypothetical protein
MCILTNIAGLQKSARLKRGFLALAIVLLSLSLGQGAAHALGIDLEKIPRVKAYDTPTQADFESRSKKMEEPFKDGDPLVAYRIYIPKDWTDNLMTTASGADVGVSWGEGAIFSMIGRYIGNAKNLQRSYVTVESDPLGHEIRARDWIVNQILSSGVSLTALTEKSPKEAEVLYVQMEKDISYVVRARVIINANQVVIVRHFLPQDNYETDMVEQQKILSSFSLLNVSDKPIENHLVFGFLDQSYFNYPESWTLKERTILTVDRMSVMLIQEKTQREEKILQGHIKVNAISRLLNIPLSKELQDFKTSLNIPGYKIGARIESLKFAKDPSITFQKTEVYRLEPDDQINMRPYEFMISVMQGAEYNYILSMISPSRDLDYYTWAKNMEVAKIVIESMRRQKEVATVSGKDPYYDYLKDKK